MLFMCAKIARVLVISIYESIPKIGPLCKIIQTEQFFSSKWSQCTKSATDLCKAIF